MPSIARQILEVTRNSGKLFRLPPGVPSTLFKITDSMSQSDAWKARIVVANSTSTKKKGDWDKVRYVMISIRDNTIVPIAIGDEHHTGYDVMYDFYGQKYGVNPENYISLNSLGNNYVSEDELKGSVEACKRFLAYGGQDLPIALAGGYRKPTILMSDFIASGGFPDAGKGSLAPLGERILRQFESISKAALQARSKMSQAYENRVWTLVRELKGILYRYIINTYSFDVLQDEDLESWWDSVEHAISEENLETVMKLVFGFDGIKNKIHNNLRKALSSKDTFGLRHAILIFGDVELAVDLLGKL